MTEANLPAYEKLGAFYLGRTWDPETTQTSDEPLLYDARDLVTHAICVGMTGSGKTGLCIDLLEEAAIDGIPSLVIDVKGDMGNLLLHFPELRGEDFAPWTDPGEAQRAGRSLEEHADFMANIWRSGLAEWDQDPDRIKRLRDAADFAIYTPGGDAGLGLTVLRSFAAPPEELRADRELFGDRVQASVAGLLALLGSSADPLQSREAVLLSNLLTHHWQKGEGLDLAGLIHGVQSPPFDKLGVLDLETFFPAKDRTQLALSINSLLASPGFQSWLEGEPLDISRLLWTPEGKPRVSVISIAHLSDAERMFFVTTLLNEMVSWMRTQSGTGSLRALLYMDEIFGYFPPSAAPPSKKPMLTLLKQARAFGIGVVLATQNPVDLDYKGLSNTGTWFLGRLQTERDKLRVLDGLEGAMSSGGQSFDRKQLDAMLSGLGKRVFLLHNVHEDGPVLFQTRFALNYLRGPLDRGGITRLMAERKAAVAQTQPTSQTSAAPAATAAPQAARPALPKGIPELYGEATRPLPDGARLVYRPYLDAEIRLHFTRASLSTDLWESRRARVPILEEKNGPAWKEAAYPKPEDAGHAAKQPEDEEAGFGELCGEALSAKAWKSWNKSLIAEVYQTQALTFWRTKKPKLVSTPGEARGDFTARLDLALREARDADIDKLKDRYRSKFRTAEDGVRRAGAKLEKEEEQLSQAKTDKWLTVGKSLLGSLFGRKGRGSSMSKIGRQSREKIDVAAAKDELEARQRKFLDLEEELQSEIDELEVEWRLDNIDVEEIVLRPRKSDIAVNELGLLWAPYAVFDDGRTQPLG